MKFYQFHEKEKRIDVYNERWYPNADETKWYRNITTILGVIDKGYQYDEWLKNVGHNAEIIVDRAGKLGSAAHHLIERTLLKETVSFDDIREHGEQQATSYWERYLTWCKFWKELNEDYEVEYKPEWVELVALSDTYEYGSTIDLIAKLTEKKKNAKSKLVDIDWKTGNSIQDKAKLQLVAGMRAFEEMMGERVDIGMIVHLPSEKPNKKGYRIHEVENSDSLFEIVKATKKIYDFNSRGNDPKFLSYPMEMNLNDILTNNIITIGE
jgi:hypothetical protein